MKCGIDFGTRNTAIAKGSLRVTGDDGGTVPSYVAYSRKGLPRRIGKSAMQLFGEAGLVTDWDVWRSFKLDLPQSDGSQGCRVTRVTADFLHDVLRLPSAGTSAVSDAVMAIPVAWPPAARRALRSAASAAGIRLQGFVSESTAAFAKHRDEFGAVEEVAVFDWGAGTLDVSVLRLRGGGHGARTIEELHCACSDRAGDFIDLLLAEHIHRRFAASDNALRPWAEVESTDRDRLCKQVELAKIALSDERVSSVPISIAGYCGRPRSTTINAAEFEAAVAPVLQHVVETLEGALARAGTSAARVDALLVVGGCSKVLGLARRLHDLFGGRVATSRDSEWSVAEGAQRIADAGESCYACVQQFCLILSDGLALPLAGPEARFDGSPTTHVVGKVDDSKVASLVLGERDRGSQGDARVIGSLAVRSQGLPGEPIIVESTLDPDLFLRVRATSMLSLPAKDAVTFEFPSTRFEYRL
jgi:molecular chaperone DnaK